MLRFHSPTSTVHAPVDKADMVAVIDVAPPVPVILKTWSMEIAGLKLVLRVEQPPGQRVQVPPPPLAEVMCCWVDLVIMAAVTKILFAVVAVNPETVQLVEAAEQEKFATFWTKLQVIGAPAGIKKARWPTCHC